MPKQEGQSNKRFSKMLDEDNLWVIYYKCRRPVHIMTSCLKKILN